MENHQEHLLAETRTTCPFLGLHNDPETHYGYATISNYCHRATLVEPVLLHYQEAICLSREFRACPAYQESWEGPLPTEIRGQVLPTRGISRLANVLLTGIANIKARSRKIHPLIPLLLAVFVVTMLPNLTFAIIAPDPSVVGKHFGDDDAYYYFQVARNIASGHGSSFDQITRTNGFHPLWMLICIPIFSLSAIDPVLPLRVVLVVSSLLHFGSMAMLLLSLQRAGVSCLAGFSAVLLFLLAPHWNADLVSGSEMALNLFLLSLFIYLLTSNRKEGSERVSRKASLLGIVASLLFLARLDNIFVILVLAVYFFWFLLVGYAKSWRQSMPFGVKYLTPLVIIVFLYALFSQLYYGGIIPVSGQVKMYWASIGGSVFGSQPQGLLDSMRNYFGATSSKAVQGPVTHVIGYLPWGSQSHLISGATGALSVFVLTQRRTVFRDLFLSLLAASILHTSYYAAVGYVQTREWYWVTEYVTVILFVALGFDGLSTVFGKKRGELAVSAIVLLYLLTALWPRYFSQVIENFEFRPTDGNNYFERVQFLEENTPENAIIGTPNAGGLGYFANRRIVNIDGLVNNYEFLESMRTQTSHLYLKRIGVNYIFVGPGYDKYEPYTSMLTDKLEFVGRWTDSSGKRPHDLFRYFPGRYADELRQVAGWIAQRGPEGPVLMADSYTSEALEFFNNFRHSITFFPSPILLATAADASSSASDLSSVQPVFVMSYSGFQTSDAGTRDLIIIGENDLIEKIQETRARYLLISGRGLFYEWYLGRAPWAVKVFESNMVRIYKIIDSDLKPPKLGPTLYVRSGDATIATFTLSDEYRQYEIVGSVLTTDNMHMYLEGAGTFYVDSVVFAIVNDDGSQTNLLSDADSGFEVDNHNWESQGNYSTERVNDGNVYEGEYALRVDSADSGLVTLLHPNYDYKDGTANVMTFFAKSPSVEPFLCVNEALDEDLAWLEQTCPQEYATVVRFLSQMALNRRAITEANCKIPLGHSP